MYFHRSEKKMGWDQQDIDKSIDKNRYSHVDDAYAIFFDKIIFRIMIEKTVIYKNKQHYINRHYL